MAAIDHERAIGRIAKYAPTILILAIFGCTAIYGGPTGYTKADAFWGSSYGYSEKIIGSEEYAITVTGNPNTSKERVADIALFRAAHLADEQKRTHFVVLNKSTHQLEGYDTITLFVGAPVLFLPVAETPKQEPHAVLIIRLLPNDQPHPDDALTAVDVIAKLGPGLE